MMEWINVNDKKPDASQPDEFGMCFESNEVLAVDKHGYFYVVKYLEYDGGDWEFCDHGIAKKDITHWMPLPEPPEGDENK